jgi:S-formylglutathione hydrolase FrmB
MRSWASSTALAAVLGAASCGGSGGVDDVTRYSIDSRYAHRKLEQALVVPEGDRRRPLLVLLHGRGGDPDDFLVGELQDALDELGDQAPVVLLPDGGDHSYWHDRREGAWGTYVLREAIPEAARHAKVDLRRVAIGGISMGGFGALDLARLTGRRFCAVGGHSAALWRTGGETPAGAFDDAEDFAHHDVLAAAGRTPFGGGPIWIDVGSEDPFRAADVEFARKAHARLHVWPGEEHSLAANRGHFRAYLRFYAWALARCRPE